MRIRPITLLLFTFLFAGQIHGQVWTLNKGQLYFNLSFSSSVYDEKYGSSGTIPLPVELTDRTFKLIAQYGLAEKLTAEIRIPYKLTSSAGDLTYFNLLYTGIYLETGELNYLGNTEAGIIYKFVEDKPMVSASLFVEANTTDHNYLTGLQSGFNSWGFKPGAGVGWSFPKSWMSFYLGGDIRTNNYSSSILSELELGYRPVSFIYLAGDINVKRSLNNGTGDCDCTTEYSALYLNNQEYLAYALKAGFNYREWGLNLGYSSAFSANNLPAKGVPTIGIEFKSKAE